MWLLLAAMMVSFTRCVQTRRRHTGGVSKTIAGMVFRRNSLHAAVVIIIIRSPHNIIIVVIVAVACLRELQNGKETEWEKHKKNYFRRKNSDRTSARVRMLRVLATADWRVWPRARARGRDNEVNNNDRTR